MSLRDLDTLTFDVIGTLIDFEAGLLAWMRPRLQAVRPDITDAEILTAYAEEESLHHDESEELYQNLNQTQTLPLCWAAIAKRYGAEASEEDTQSIRDSVADWPPFPDSVAALAYLRQHFRLVTLTNASRESAQLMARTLGNPFHRILTAEDAGATKPDPRAFHFLLRTLKDDNNVDQASGRLSPAHTARPLSILHVAQSQFHDIGVAKSLGLKTAWIRRRNNGEGGGGTPAAPEEVDSDFTFSSLAELAEAHKRAMDPQ